MALDVPNMAQRCAAHGTGPPLNAIVVSSLDKKK